MKTKENKSVGLLKTLFELFIQVISTSSFMGLQLYLTFVIFFWIFNNKNIIYYNKYIIPHVMSL